jgi:hypothetical protein
MAAGSDHHPVFGDTMTIFQLIARSALMASLLAGCGGGGGGDATGAPSTPAQPTPNPPTQPTPTPPAEPTPTPPVQTPDTGTPGGPATSTWTNVKFGGGGYVPGLVFHPTTPDLLYARTDIGGAYRWDPSGAAWRPITDAFHASEGFHHGAESIALDPNDDRRVYMSTGMSISDQPTGRLYISTDRGEHWQHVNLPFAVGTNNQGRAIGERMAVDPNLPSTLFYGSRTAGLWKSADHGKTWQQVQSLATARMTQAQIDAADRGNAIGVQQVLFDTSSKGGGSATPTIYVSVAPDYAGVAKLTHSLYKSTDGGASWTGVATPVRGAHIPHMARAADGRFYIPFTVGSGPGANGAASLYRFDGANWTLLKSYEPTQWTSFGMGGVSVSGSGATTRIALGVTNSWGNWEGQPVVQLSDDAGATWREIGSMTPHTPSDADGAGWVDDVEINPHNPDHILRVFGGGVWETKNASAAKPSWKLLVEGMEETATLGLATPPAGASYTLLNSSGDVGMHVHTDLAVKPTRGPRGVFANGNSADMAWATPSYIAAIGISTWEHRTVGGVYSTDSGVTWTPFAANHPDGMANRGGESNLAVTKPGHIVWAPTNSVPAYTTNHGATWTYTNLPALASVNIGRSYRLAADRKNPDRMYAYDSGGGWWGPAPKFYYSTDGGRTFTASAGFAALGARAEFFNNTSMAVNPNAEGEVWVADGHTIYHSTDAGATWKKLSVTASIWGGRPTTQYPDVYGASALALGKAPAGAKHSSSLYLVGVIGGVWGVHRSDDAGATWRRINDDQHQFGGIGMIAADQGIAGRLYISGSGRGILFNN